VKQPKNIKGTKNGTLNKVLTLPIKVRY